MSPRKVVLSLVMCGVFLSSAAWAGSISGTVSFAPGGVLPTAVVVRVFDLENLNLAYAETSTEQGWKYVVAGVGSGPRRVFFHPVDSAGNWIGEYRDRWYDGADDYGTALTVNVPAGETLDGVDILLDRWGSITGDITFEPGDVVPSELQVLVYDNPECYDPLDYVRWTIVKTQESCHYRVSGLAGGEYRVFVSDPYAGGSGSWYENGFSPATATPVPVTAGLVTGGVDVTLQHFRSISGTIHFPPAGSPPPEWVEVELIDAEGNRAGWAYAIAADGYRYRVGAGEAGSYRVHFKPFGGPYAAVWYGGVYNAADATRVEALDGEETGGVDVFLAVGGRIAGRLLMEPGGQPPQHVTVEVFNERGENVEIAYADKEHGYRYRVVGLEPGSYTLFFLTWEERGVGDYFSTWYRNPRTKGRKATPVKVALGRTTGPVNPVLRLGGSIAGQLSFEEGGRLPYFGQVDISAYDHNGRLAGWATADLNNGWRYVMRQLRTGNYKLYVFPQNSDYVGRWYGPARLQSEAREVPVVVGERTSGVDLRLPLGGVITGKVTFHGFDPHPQHVYVGPSTENGGAFGLTGVASAESGWTYRIGGLDSGDYLLEFSSDANDYSYQYYPGTFVRDDARPVRVAVGKKKTGIDYTMESGGRITGRLEIPPGFERYLISILAVPADYPTGSARDAGSASGTARDAGSASRSGVMSSDGTYTIYGLEPDDYVVSFRTYENLLEEWYPNAHEREGAARVAVTAGSTTTGIDAVMDIGGTLAGTVTFAGSAARPAGVGLKVQDEHGVVVREPTAFESEGYVFRVEGLSPGLYTLSCTAYYGGWQTQWYDRATTIEDAVQIPVSQGTVATGIDVVLTPLPTDGGRGGASHAPDAGNLH